MRVIEDIKDTECVEVKILKILNMWKLLKILKILNMGKLLKILKILNMWKLYIYKILKHMKIFKQLRYNIKATKI